MMTNNQQTSFDIFIPIDRRIQLTTGGRLPERTSGAALFADISGFTPLSNALVKALGPQQGPEELTIQINRVYSTLIEIVHRYRGSTIAFSGDAITCWFDDETNNDISSAGLRAAASALEMQEAMNQLLKIILPNREEITLGIKISIAIGPVRRFIVGDPNIQQIDVLAGLTLDVMAAGEKLANSGEIIVGPEMVSKFTRQLSVGKTYSGGFGLLVSQKLRVNPSPWQALPESSITEAEAKTWMIPGILDRFVYAGGRYLSELRRVAALFVRFGGIDYDGDETAGEKLDAFIRKTQFIVNHYEGALTQITFGDKGSYLLCTFGAPRAHEDDPQRAALAAMDIRASLNELEFIRGAQFGIAAGIVRAGTYGGKNRRIYGTQGKEVNLAARLMTYAKDGEIVVSKHVINELKGFTVKPLEPATMKGFAKPVPIFLLEAKRGVEQAAKTETPMVGRQKERTFLQGRLETMKNGEPAKIYGTVFIEGEAGIGKSRLIENVVETGESMGFEILIGDADAVEQATSYLIWRPIFRKIFEVTDERDSGENRDLILSELGKKTLPVEKAPLLNAVMAVDFPENQLTGQMSGEVRADNTNDFLIQILNEHFKKQKGLLVLDDAHWMDSLSWAVLQQVNKQVSNALTIAALRPLLDSPPLEYHDIQKQTTTGALKLDSIAPDEIAMLVKQRLGIGNIPDEMETLIRQKAQGNPFFVEEIAYALRDAGLILIKDGRCEIAPKTSLLEIDFPDTVQGVVRSRIDRLSASQQLTLKVASVIGRLFSFRTLQDTHPVTADRDRLTEYLLALEKLDITPLETPEPDLTYIFKHIITQEVVYNLLLFSQRRQLHEVIAAWYESNLKKDLSPFYPLLADHWSKAIETPGNNQPTWKAIEYLEKSGTAALDGFANKEAVKFFSAALEFTQKGKLDVTPMRLAFWEGQLGQAYLGLGQLPLSKSYFENSLGHLGWPTPKNTFGLILSTLVEVGRQMFHRFVKSPKAKSYAHRKSIIEAVRAYERLGEIYYFESNTIASILSILKTLNLAEQAGLSKELGRAFGNMTAAISLVGLEAVSDFYLRKSTETANALDDPITTALVLSRVSLFTIVVGRWEAARRDLKQAKAIAEKYGDLRLWGESNANLGISIYFQGDFHLSKQYLSEIKERGKLSDDIQHQSWVYYVAMPNLALGKTDESIELLKEALGLFEIQGEINGEIITHGQLGKAYLRKGEDGNALKHAALASDLISQVSPTAYSNIEGYSGPAEVFLSLWDQDQMKGVSASPHESAAKKSIKAYSSLSALFPVCQPRAALLRGKYELLSGSPDKAFRTWQKGLEQAEKYELPYEKGLLYFAMGQGAEKGSGKKREHLETAVNLFRDLNAAFDLALAEEALTG